jgi:hypothetical protein
MLHLIVYDAFLVDIDAFLVLNPRAKNRKTIECVTSP